MKRAHLLRTVALAALLVSASTARADLIPWGFDWFATPGAVFAGASKITLSNEGYNTATDNSFVVATNLKEFSSAPAGTPDVFGPADGFYALTVNLKDITSNQVGSLTFLGQLQGKFSQFNSQVTNTFLNPITQTLDLGNTQFTVTMTSYTPPGPESQGNLGSIGAFVTVDYLVEPADQAPEPTSMALAGIGVGLAGFSAWRRRRAQTTPV